MTADELYDYFTDAQLAPDIREGKPCPQPAVRLILADRWHMTPWSFDDAPVDQFLYWLNVLNIEAEAHTDRAGMDPSEPSYKMD